MGKYGESLHHPCAHCGALGKGPFLSEPKPTPPEQRIRELEAALRECYGSYRSLVGNLRGLGLTAEGWDGPVCARRALGIEGSN